MAVQTGEGTKEIIYGSSTIPAGALTLGSYIARPDLSGEWPTILVLGPEPEPTSTVKDICRTLARHGFAAVAPELSTNHASNASMMARVAAFVTRKNGGWSNARFGYGVLAFGDGIIDGGWLTSHDGRAMALAAVGATIDPPVSENLAVADIPILFLGSRADDSVDIDASVDAQKDLPRTTYVVYNEADTRWWDVDAPGFDEDDAKDTFERVFEFLHEQLPARV